MSAITSFEVLCPQAETVTKEINPAPALSDLKGKKIALIWTAFTNGDTLADALANSISQSYKETLTVNLTPGKGVAWGTYPDESLTDLVKEAGVDAAVVLVGG